MQEQVTIVPVRLARYFHVHIQSALDAEELAEADAKNLTPEYGPTVCATHDYCDANMSMAAAFEWLWGRELDFDNPLDLAMWDAAWVIAKEHGYSKKWSLGSS